MRVRRTLAAALAVMFALVATGCAEGPEPKFAEPTTASPTDEPTETESEEPEAESPEEFIRRWARVEMTMENTGETTEYRAMSKGCKACLDLADLVEQYYTAGGFVKWKGWRIQSITHAPKYGPEAYKVRVDSEPTSYRESASAKVGRLEGGPSIHLLRLASAGHSWVVADKTELPG